LNKIAIVTDSVATVPEDLVKQYGIHVIPIHITWDKVRYHDGVDIKPGEFFKRLRKSHTLPTTSSGVMGEMSELFQSLQGKVDGIVAILFSSKLGISYSSAINAREMVKGVPVEVIDSKFVLMGEGFAALEAARAAKNGATMEQVVKIANEMIGKVHTYFALDTFEYMRRGGRVSFSKAALATLLRVKPIMGLLDGKIEPVAKPRTMPAAIKAMVDIMKEKTTGTPLHVSVTHADNPKDAEILKNQIEASFTCKEMFFSEVTPVIGTHFGPGAVGVAFYNG
jgi:DegV family protein with EDD domain